jgi:hypothetical protein
MPDNKRVLFNDHLSVSLITTEDLSLQYRHYGLNGEVPPKRSPNDDQRGWSGFHLDSRLVMNGLGSSVVRHLHRGSQSRDNVIHDTKGEGMHYRNHQSAVVGNLTTVHNTILSEKSIRIVAPEKFSGPIIVANKALAAKPRIPTDPAITQSGNLLGIEEAFPAPSSPWLNSANPTYLTKIDFNQSKRQNSKDLGAYKYATKGNPGWAISKQFKIFVPGFEKKK